MIGVLALLLVGSAFRHTEALRCRHCVDAATIEDCGTTVTCAADEVCDMRQGILVNGTKVFNGGCIATTRCSAGLINGINFGKRTGEIIHCHKCCNYDAKPECNEGLCGLHLRGSTSCYDCAGVHAVMDPRRCSTTTVCQPGELCAAQTLHPYKGIDIRKFEFKCMNQTRCTQLVHDALVRMDQCRNPAARSHVTCLEGGKLSPAGSGTCTACCGDEMCNAGTCEEALERMYALWKAGRFDLNTLKVTSIV